MIDLVLFFYNGLIIILNWIFNNYICLFISGGKFLV